jgi:hypothetical protein
LFGATFNDSYRYWYWSAGFESYRYWYWSAGFESYRYWYWSAGFESYRYWYWSAGFENDVSNSRLQASNDRLTIHNNLEVSDIGII